MDRSTPSISTMVFRSLEGAVLQRIRGMMGLMAVRALALGCMCSSTGWIGESGTMSEQRKRASEAALERGDTSRGFHVQIAMATDVTCCGAA